MTPRLHGSTSGAGRSDSVKLIAGLILIAAAASTGAFLYLNDGTPASEGSSSGGNWLTRTAPATKTPRGTATPAPTSTPSAPPLPWSYPAAAPPEVYAMECRGTGTHSARVFLLWNPARSGTQYLDVSIFNNGFAPGTFLGIGPYGKDTWGYLLDGALQGTSHSVRVNTWTGTAWAPSYTVNFFTPVCDRNAYDPAPGADMVGLRNQIGGAILTAQLNVAVAVTDLQTGETIDVNGADVRLPGCTINLFALMAVVQGLQAGRYPEPLPGDLIGQTINRSDPITARRLMREWVGGGDLYRGLNAINAMMRALGMNSTFLDHPPAFVQESLGGGINNSITALDANRGLRALWDGQVVSPQWRDYLLQKMTLVKPGLQYIIGSAGYDAIQSHKNGFLYEQGWADNDIGIVWFERGGQRYGYAISFYSQYLPGKYSAIPVAQQIASLAYTWFVGRYGYP
jgi:beta-lactamase class A